MKRLSGTAAIHERQRRVSRTGVHASWGVTPGVLTVAFMTNRVDPKLEWFLDGWHRQTGGNYEGVKFVMVDFYCDTRDVRELFFSGLNRIEDGGGTIVHVPPKPTVWQGPHRLTSADYFAAANARNTALCLAPDGAICFVDDLSVPMPGWWQAVKEAAQRPQVTCGAYAKHFDMVVEDGVLVSSRENPVGKDVRLHQVSGSGPHSCQAGWMFGSSLCAPVEAFLAVGGWGEICDSNGFEDCVTGGVLANAGAGFLYAPKMMMIESEELHFVDKAFLRIDKGVSPSDRSHWLLTRHKYASHFDNPFDIRELRERVLAGEPFPPPSGMTHDPYDDQPISEM